MSGLLLPTDRDVGPFEESSHLIGDRSALHETAAEQGYLYLQSFVPDSLLLPVRSFTREAFAQYGWVRPDEENPPTMQAVPDAKLSGRGWDDRDWVQFQLTFSKHPDFLALAEAPYIMEVLEAIMGEAPWLASMNFCHIKLPGNPEQTTLPHQDAWYLPQCKRMWTMWVPLVDTPFEVGPLGVVAGSQKRDVEDHFTAFSGLQVEPKVEFASSEVKAGDVVFYAARTIHCQWSNVSTTFAQVSADVRYEPKSVGKDSKLRRKPK